MPKAVTQRSSALVNHYSDRMILAYRYGSLVLAALGAVWAVVFSLVGWWWVVALDFAIIACGLSIYWLIRIGHLTFGLLLAQVAIIAICLIMALLIDPPSVNGPRVTHIYLLVVAALGYLNYQRDGSRVQLSLIGFCLLAFIVLSSASLSSHALIEMPDWLRLGGTWFNSFVATSMLAGCIYVMQAEFNRKDRTSRELMAALWNGEFHLVYQPQVDGDGMVIGAEALLRWNSPKRGLVSPAEFIPEAESLGLMIPIGNWVLEKGCSTLAAWDSIPGLRHLTLSVNVSADQLMDKGFVEQVRETLITTGAKPQKLTLELTESILVSEVEQVIERLRELHEMGMTIALDDFGTGYSSLSYLRRLPIQMVKIDRSFVQDATSGQASASLVGNVVAMAQDLGLEVIAEGVETREQHALMAGFGCAKFQGYLYGRPVPLADFESRAGDKALTTGD
ncbi:putative bifunctional diguanylate cyclase/phosphodiesterase [Hoeflea alexandrii]|uniref:putative bifunctional diguanylate cyclase/phosphodiesterase n=1 Tax=Hoeflea alexandrii TaxID=288436 RepID=UPI0022AE773F|nr:EAL domain-containing protein [Hoeflea alexandrii]MCZ4288744.1 EAL domain-containing protein [Hoeflea alexandrii]